MGTLEEITLEESREFFEHCENVKSLTRKDTVAVIWLALVWSIWLKRNAVIFKGEVFSFTNCMTEIISISWRWLASYYKPLDNCNFHIWNILQITCYE